MNKPNDPDDTQEQPEAVYGIEDAIEEMGAETVQWENLLEFSYRSFYELNEEFDHIRERIAEMEEMGDQAAAQNQMDMANFFMGARDNSMILHTIGRIGLDIRNINDRLARMDKRINDIRADSSEK